MSHIVKFTKQHSYTSSAIHLSQSSRVKLGFSVVSSCSLSLSRIRYLAFVTWRWRLLLCVGIRVHYWALVFITWCLLAFCDGPAASLAHSLCPPFCPLSSKYERTLRIINRTFVRWPPVIICSVKWVECTFVLWALHKWTRYTCNMFIESLAAHPLRKPGSSC